MSSRNVRAGVQPLVAQTAGASTIIPTVHTHAANARLAAHDVRVLKSAAWEFLVRVASGFVAEPFLNAALLTMWKAQRRRTMTQVYPY
jgi:hypothetical protein